MQNEVYENKMGYMPVNKLLISMSLPIILSMFVMSLYNIVDSIFVAMINEDALTAVTLAFPVQQFSIAVGIGTYIGVNALLSRSLGEKNLEKANKIAENGLFITIISYLVFLIFGIFFAKAFISAQTDSQQIINYGTSYISITCIFSFGILAQNAFEKTLMSTGKTIYTMITQLIGAVINIILDPILIFGLLGFPQLGVAGAAYATVIGQIVAAILAIIFNKKYNQEIKISRNLLKPDLHVIRNIFAIGLPSIIMLSISSVLTFFMNKILAVFSTTAIAVYGIYFKLQSFVFMPVFGLNNGMVPIIAYNYGAGQKDRIVKTIKLSIIYAIAIMLIGLIILQVFPRQLLLLFSASENMMEIGVPALRIISVCMVFAGFNIIVSSVFQAFGKSMLSLISSIFRQLIILLPAAYILSKIGEVNYIWLAFPISEIVTTVLCIIFLKYIFKSVINKIPQV